MNHPLSVNHGGCPHLSQSHSHLPCLTVMVAFVTVWNALLIPDLLCDSLWLDCQFHESRTMAVGLHGIPHAGNSSWHLLGTD